MQWKHCGLPPTRATSIQPRDEYFDDNSDLPPLLSCLWRLVPEFPCSVRNTYILLSVSVHSRPWTPTNKDPASNPPRPTQNDEPKEPLRRRLACMFAAFPYFLPPEVNYHSLPAFEIIYRASFLNYIWRFLTSQISMPKWYSDMQTCFRCHAQFSHSFFLWIPATYRITS